MTPEIIGFFRAAFLRHGPRRYAVMQPQGADRKYDDFPGQLTDRQLAAHLEGHAAYAVPTAQDGLTHFLPLDIDAGGDSAARALLDAASARNLWAFAQVDNARGRGYVWIPFDDLTNADRIRRLGDELLDQVQPEAHGWRIENRATNEDTRLPFARHRWTGKRGRLIAQNGHTADLDGNGYAEQLAAFARDYRENPASTLPPPPEERAPMQARQPQASGQGITIARYNADTDLVTLLEHYGARRARGQGARLYFCPLHTDDHASLLVTRQGDKCRCMSTGSDCPLSVHQHDAFNVFCAAEGLTPQQALRRLNGLPDDPEKGGAQTPPAGPGGARNAREEKIPPPHRDARQRPQERPRGQKIDPLATALAGGVPFAAVRPSYEPGDASNGRTSPSDGRRLPKTCRRVLEIIRQHPGGYIRGKYHLAELLDCDPRTVQRSLRRLEAERLITRHERGRDGQTDIYQLARIEEGAAKRVSAPEMQEPEGRQLSPTVVLDSIPTLETFEAERGGSCPEADDQGEAIHGPAGAFVIPGGAAFIPPEAADWYSGLLQLAPQAAAPEPEPEQIALDPPDQVQASEIPAQAPRTARKRRKQSRHVDPGRLHGRIIAAERKAAKLEKGNAAEQRQARAIRRSAEQLKRQMETLRERLFSAEDAEHWQPPEDTAPQAERAADAPPYSSTRGVDWSYVARLAHIGERRGIETHCMLCGVSVGEVAAELARRGVSIAGGVG